MRCGLAYPSILLEPKQCHQDNYIKPHLIMRLVLYWIRKTRIIPYYKTKYCFIEWITVLLRTSAILLIFFFKILNLNARWTGVNGIVSLKTCHNGLVVGQYWADSVSIGPVGERGAKSTGLSEPTPLFWFVFFLWWEIPICGNVGMIPGHLPFEEKSWRTRGMWCSSKPVISRVKVTFSRRGNADMGVGVTPLRHVDFAPPRHI